MNLIKSNKMILIFPITILAMLSLAYFIIFDKQKKDIQEKITTQEVNDYIQAIYPVTAAACRCMILTFEMSDTDIIEVGLKEKEITENDEKLVVKFKNEVNEKFENRIKAEKIITLGSQYMEILYVNGTAIKWDGEEK